jgi:2-isopropylmalate synthase
MKEEHGFDLPRRFQIEFSKTIQHITEDSGTEITPDAMWDAFQATYIPTDPRFRLLRHELHTSTAGGEGHTTLSAEVEVDGRQISTVGDGDGPVEAFVEALRGQWGDEFDVVDYTEHAIGSGADAKAVAYVESVDDRGDLRWGIGIDSNITTASLLAVLSAFDRQHQS